MYNLVDRTKNIAERIREWMKNVPRTISNLEDLKQLARSSGSVAANAIEADEALSKVDFRYRIKVCRKEAKESKLWLFLLMLSQKEHDEVRLIFAREYDELVRIFSSILKNSL